MMRRVIIELGKGLPGLPRVVELPNEVEIEIRQFADTLEAELERTDIFRSEGGFIWHGVRDEH